MPEPWEIYASSERPSSSDRVMLADVLEAYCLDYWFMKPSDIRDAFLDLPGANRAERDRSEIRSSLTRLGRVFMKGEVRTFVRPIGGGVPSLLPSGHWEIDDFEPRFATCTVDPARWWDPSAPGTHWILVDGPAIEKWLDVNKADSWLDRVDLPTEFLSLPQQSDSDPTRRAATGSAAAVPSKFLRLGDVIARTGLSRSSIYERMASQTFPKQRAVGGRAVMWLESEVAAWQQQRIDFQSSLPTAKGGHPAPGGGPAPGRAAS